jgi:hypothetical protein
MRVVDVSAGMASMHVAETKKKHVWRQDKKHQL